MIGQLKEIDAEGRHERGMMRGDKAGVGSHVRISGREPLGVVVGGGCGWSLGIVDERALQFVRNHAKFVAAHVEQHVDAGLNADAVGRSNELAVGDEARLVGVGNDPLGVGGSQILS
jgi:hypothetical protein